MRQITEFEEYYSVKFDYNKIVYDELEKLTEKSFVWQSKEWRIPKYLKPQIEVFAKNNKFDFQRLPVNLLEGVLLNVNIPLKLKLMPHQEWGVSYNLKHKKVLIGDQMGVGKTAQAIASVSAANAFPCLVICPSTPRPNWEKEWKMWTDHNPMILSSSTNNSWDMLYQMNFSDVFITNYESLKKYFVLDIQKPKGEKLQLKHIRFSDKIKIFKSIIIDESHRVKEPTAMQTMLCYGLAHGKEYRYLLSGTPVLNKPEDLITQLSILGQLKAFGGTTGFKMRYSGKENRHNLEELQILLKNTCYYRREKSECLTLPEKTRVIIYCDITTRDEYEVAEKDLAQYLREYKNATDKQVRISLRGAVMVRIGILKEISARGKIAAVKDYMFDVRESGEKMILFSHLVAVQDELMKAIPKAITIFGKDDMLTRQRNLDKFQNDPDCQFAFFSIKAASEAITATAANIVGFIEFPWTSGLADQCEDRAHRKGVRHPVTCPYFAGKNTIDEHILNIIEEKRSISNAITGAVDDVETKIQDEVINRLIELL